MLRCRGAAETVALKMPLREYRQALFTVALAGQIAILEGGA